MFLMHQNLVLGQRYYNGALSKILCKTCWTMSWYLVHARKPQSWPTQDTYTNNTYQECIKSYLLGCWQFLCLSMFFTVNWGVKHAAQLTSKATDNKDSGWQMPAAFQPPSFWLKHMLLKQYYVITLISLNIMGVKTISTLFY